jgi:G3E family GTPase
VDNMLGDQRQFDAVVVELSGVADPLAIKSNWNAAKMQGHPVTNKADISQIVTLVDAATFGTDWMTWDVAGERKGWVDPADECAAERKVPELLAEQVEAATVILLNKVDLAGPEQVEVASSLARSLNKDAVMEEVEYGRVSPNQILRLTVPDPVVDKDDSSVSSCQKPDCSDSSHSHGHEHASASCNEPGCNDPSHSHSDSQDDGKCSEPDCTDTSHLHEHSHSTSTDKLGIVNFVYKSDRPFDTRKLLTLLNKWPVPIKDDLDLSLLIDAQKEGYEVEGTYDEGSPFVGVLRSKGFSWFAPTKWSGPNEDVWRHDTAMFWSHAGKHFGISSAGKWWGTISKEQMKKYFQDDMEEHERIRKEDFVSEEFGDRRQEIVFIGVALNEEEIKHALDQCLLTEKGMDRYRQELRNYMNTVLTSPAGGAGLFDVGGVDHMDV